MRGYAKNGVAQAIREAGGEIYAITSEPQTLARNAQEDWETGLVHIGDPHHEISAACAERGWLSLFVNEFGHREAERPTSDWVAHPKGYFQPGVLVLDPTGRVLYRWRSRPTRKNVGGAISRPTAGHVWSRVQVARLEPSGAPDAPPDQNPEMDTPAVPFPLFILLVLANGWFLGPVFFDQRAGEGDTVLRRQRNAFIRIGLFAAAWIAAGAFLPGWLVGTAFVAWVAKVAPGVRMIYERFQNVGATEEPV